MERKFCKIVLVILLQVCAIYILHQLLVTAPEGDIYTEPPTIPTKHNNCTEPPAIPINHELRKSIGNQTAFSLRLAEFVGSRSDGAADSNFAFSGLSFHVLLTLLAAGSRGPTRDQILSFLGSDAGSSAAAEDLVALSRYVIDSVLADGSCFGGPRVACANGVWVDASLSLKPSFKEIVVSAYKGDIQSVDFQTKAAEVSKQVNSWVEYVTAGLIKDLLPPGSLNSNTKLVLGNALYFKGEWLNKFDESRTRDYEFHLLKGGSVQVPFMTNTEWQFVSVFPGFKVLGLSYKHGQDRRRFSLYIFLPDVRDGLWSLARELGSQQDFLEHHLPAIKVKLRKFRIPKFKISFKFEASKFIKDLGLVLPFHMSTDLAEMADPPPGQQFMVSDIYHKSFIEVNEEGTEAAAAATAVIVGCRSAFNPEPSIDFVADHPFLFLIREDISGVVLFSGHVLNP